MRASIGENLEVVLGYRSCGGSSDVAALTALFLIDRTKFLAAINDFRHNGMGFGFEY